MLFIVHFFYSFSYRCLKTITKFSKIYPSRCNRNIHCYFTQVIAIPVSPSCFFLFYMLFGYFLSCSFILSTKINHLNFFVLFAIASLIENDSHNTFISLKYLDFFLRINPFSSYFNLINFLLFHTIIIFILHGCKGLTFCQCNIFLDFY